LDESRAIEAYLRENYEYSTSIGQPPQGRDRVAWFLFENKRGYCEYYASAMIVMLRSLDVPARFAAGYAPGSYDAKEKQFVVRESAAHAWPEVYFPGYGWIQFEPTPSQPVRSEAIQPAEEPTPFGAIAPEPTITVAAPDPERGLGENEPQLTDGSGGGGFSLPFGLGGPGGGWVLLSLLAGGAGLGAVFFVRRQPRTAASPGVYYGKLLSLSRFLRLGPASHQTPYEFSETLGREFPGTSSLARTISRGYVRERFSPRPSGWPCRRHGIRYGGVWCALCLRGRSEGGSRAGSDRPRRAGSRAVRPAPLFPWRDGWRVNAIFMRGCLTVHIPDGNIKLEYRLSGVLPRACQVLAIFLTRPITIWRTA
jgi:hypothetical protein